ncbi:unnamed protein product [Orchesella dallaii]|uniref:Dynein heavy chain linker domain-containing protein n=1 Tax=Orchesella dallaii TaxID=48710 RepID=A0ABP1QQN5_9HEXA
MDIATKMEHLMSELNEFQCKQREFHESVIVTDHPGRSPELRKALCNMEFSAQTRKAQFKIMLDREYQIWKQIKFEWFKPLIDADFGNMTMEELHAMVKKCKDGVKIAIEKNDVFKNLMETWTPLKTELCAGMDELRLRVFPPY